MYKQCKTEKSAIRQRQFEYGLLELMGTRPYNEITVSDLCDHMQIPRKSFYRYFSSKDGALNALLDHTMMDFESFNVLYAKGSSRTLNKELSQFFLFWMERKNLLDALAKNNLCGYLVERTMSHISAGQLIPQRFLNEETHYARKQISLFCVSGLMSIVLTWHRDGFPHSPEHMATIAARLVSEPLFPNLKQMM
jgi:AcrR family transcriptional regulator